MLGIKSIIIEIIMKLSSFDNTLQKDRTIHFLSSNGLNARWSLRGCCKIFFLNLCEWNNLRKQRERNWVRKTREEIKTGKWCRYTWRKTQTRENTGRSGKKSLASPRFYLLFLTPFHSYKYSDDGSVHLRSLLISFLQALRFSFVTLRYQKISND